MEMFAKNNKIFYQFDMKIKIFPENQHAHFLQKKLRSALADFLTICSLFNLLLPKTN